MASLNNINIFHRFTVVANKIKIQNFFFRFFFISLVSAAFLKMGDDSFARSLMFQSII